MNPLFHKLARNRIAAELIYGIGRTRVVGLAYHGSVSSPLHGLQNYGYKHLDAATFRRHLEMITSEYHVLKLTELVDWIRQNRPLPRRSMFISFDDGYVGNYEVAFPLLREFGVSATFSVTTHFIESGGPLALDLLDASILFSKQNSVCFDSGEGERELPLGGETEKAAAAQAMRSVYKRLPFDKQDEFVQKWIRLMGFSRSDEVPRLGDHVRACSWPQLREMADGGMEIGSHTHRHLILGQIDPQIARAELQDSKNLIEEKLSTPCPLFCYPNGSYPADGNEKTDLLVEEAGYLGSTYMYGGVTLSTTSPYAIKRHCIGTNTSDARLKQILSIAR